MTGLFTRQVNPELLIGYFREVAGTSVALLPTSWNPVRQTHRGRKLTEDEVEESTQGNKPSCNITIRGDGDISEGNNIEYLKTLGADKPILGSINVPHIGQQIQVEISGRVKGTSNFTLRQLKNSTGGTFNQDQNVFIPYFRGRR